jgi:hypothetical protein
MARPEKITFGDMRASGRPRGVLIYCSDYHSHSTAISGDRWPDDVRLSDLEPRGSPAKRAASAAPTSGRISTITGWPPYLPQNDALTGNVDSEPPR